MVDSDDGTLPPEAGAASSDTPAPAMPQPAEVVDMAAAKQRKARGAKAAASSGSPPGPSPGADAPPKGTGGKPKKAEKTTDWGVVNFLLDKFALIYGTDTVWDGANRLIMKISNMAHAHGSDYVKIWKANERRRTVMPADVVFDPTCTCDPERCVNLFGGFELQPRQGDVEPFLALARYLTSRASDNADECDEIFNWLLCWLAYPLQHPGAKLRTAVIMHGDEGAGKNFLFECVLEIYGKYGALVGQDELEDKFNDWRSGKCMVIGDEVSTRQELLHQKNRLKALITSPTVQINPKNLPRREERNHINIVFLSNELQPLALDNSDRRYLVVYTPRMRERQFYEKLKAWRDADGIAALYHYLLAYPLDGFDPYAPAPATEAKRALIDLNRKSPERFWLEWSGGEIDLPYWSRSMAQAYRAYIKYAQRIGDRFPVQRNLFTSMLLRISEAMADAVGKEPARQIVAKVETDGQDKATRMLLVCAIPDDVIVAKKMGEWATESVAKFEPVLRDYLGYERFDPRSPDGGDTGGDAGKGGSK